MPVVAALPAIAGGLGAASSAVSLFSGGGGGGGAPSGMPDPSTGFSKPINQEQINTAYEASRGSIKQQQALVNAIKAQGGLGNQSDVYNQLAGVAAGTGPNPAQAMLANTTGQNVANQAALMASQRGASANPAMLARLAAQQGGALQQQAVGQGAALQAQQSLGALGQMGGVANQQAAQQLQAQQALTNAAQNLHQNELNAQAQYNSTLMGGQQSANTANASMANQRSQQMSNLTGNLAGATGTALGFLGKGGGGGGAPAWGGAETNPNAANFVGPVMQAEGGMISPVMSHLTGAPMAKGGNVGSQLKVGGKVPGKPQVGGAVNSYKNDTVKALLSPGEIVIPRSITQGKDPIKGAATFVAAQMAKSGKSLPKKK